MDIKAKALEIAISQLGQQEQPKGSNKGPMVDQYLKSVGLQPGLSWCMAFAYWCYEQAAQALQVKNPLVQTGGVLAQWRQQPPEHKISVYNAGMVPSLVPPGSIFIMDFGKGMGHTGIVESFDGHIVHTVEGNSNVDGSREGYEVCRKPNGRKIATIKGFIVI
jgi:hypothetical protein